MRKLGGLAGLVLVLSTAAAGAASSAGPDPDTRSMIEALMPRTRNLLVRQKPAAAAASAASAPAAPAAAASAASAPDVAAAASAPDAAASAVAEAASAPAAAASAAAAAVAAAPVASAALPAGPPPTLSLAIQFEPNSAHVRPESGALLGTLVAAMQSPELKGTRFIIEGHSDARGAPAQNQRLSQERADEVRLYLVALGVHPSRLKAVGKGSSQLANATAPESAENRRVRVVTQE